MDVWGYYVGRFASNPGIMDYLHCWNSTALPPLARNTKSTIFLKTEKSKTHQGGGSSCLLQSYYVIYEDWLGVLNHERTENGLANLVIRAWELPVLIWLLIRTKVNRCRCFHWCHYTWAQTLRIRWFTELSIRLCRSYMVKVEMIFVIHVIREPRVWHYVDIGA